MNFQRRIFLFSRFLEIRRSQHRTTNQLLTRPHVRKERKLHF